LTIIFEHYPDVLCVFISDQARQGPFARSGVTFLHKKFPSFRENAGTSFSTNLNQTAVKITGFHFLSCDLSGMLSSLKKTELFFECSIVGDNGIWSRA
jgi:hypothetical protein